MRVNTGVINIINSNTTKCLVTQYFYIPLEVKNECELCKKPYMWKHPLIQCREIYRMSSITNNTVGKDVLTSHQRVQSSELALNRKQNAFQTHLT